MIFITINVDDTTNEWDEYHVLKEDHVQRIETKLGVSKETAILSIIFNDEEAITSPPNWEPIRENEYYHNDLQFSVSRTKAITQQEFDMISNYVRVC